MKNFDPMDLFMSFFAAIVIVMTLIVTIMLLGLLCAVFPFGLPILGFLLIWRIVYMYYHGIK